MAKYSLQSQVAEVEREIAMRKEVYPRRVQNRQMRESHATMQIELMESVLATLRWMQEHEGTIRRAVSELDARPGSEREGHAQ